MIALWSLHAVMCTEYQPTANMLCNTGAYTVLFYDVDLYR